MNGHVTSRWVGKRAETPGYGARRQSAAQSVLLPLTLLATCTGTAAIVLAASGHAWPHPVLNAEIALAFVQLSVLTHFSLFGRDMRALAVVGLIVSVFAWGTILGSSVLSQPVWLLVEGTHVAIQAGLWWLLRRGGLLVADPNEGQGMAPRGEPLAANATRAGLAIADRSNWQFSLRSALVFLTILTVVLAVVRQTFTTSFIESGSQASLLPYVMPLFAVLSVAMSVVFLSRFEAALGIRGANAKRRSRNHPADGRPSASAEAGHSFAGPSWLLAVAILVVAVILGSMSYLSTWRSELSGSLHLYFVIGLATYLQIMRVCGCRVAVPAGEGASPTSTPNRSG